MYGPHAGPRRAAGRSGGRHDGGGRVVAGRGRHCAGRGACETPRVARSAPGRAGARAGFLPRGPRPCPVSGAEGAGRRRREDASGAGDTCVGSDAVSRPIAALLGGGGSPGPPRRPSAPWPGIRTTCSPGRQGRSRSRASAATPRPWPPSRISPGCARVRWPQARATQGRPSTGRMRGAARRGAARRGPPPFRRNSGRGRQAGRAGADSRSGRSPDRVVCNPQLMRTSGPEARGRRPARPVSAAEQPSAGMPALPTTRRQVADVGGRIAGAAGMPALPTTRRQDAQSDLPPPPGAP